MEVPKHIFKVFQEGKTFFFFKFFLGWGCGFWTPMEVAKEQISSNLISQTCFFHQLYSMVVVKQLKRRD